MAVQKIYVEPCATDGPVPRQTQRRVCSCEQTECNHSIDDAELVGDRAWQVHCPEYHTRQSYNRTGKVPLIIYLRMPTSIACFDVKAS